MDAALLARLHDAADRHFAKAVRIVPRKGGGYVVAGPDPSRPALEIRAYVTLKAQAIKASANDANSGHNAQIVDIVDAIKFRTAALPYDVVAGDEVVSLETPERSRFQVSRVEPFGTGRTVLYLVTLGADL